MRITAAEFTEELKVVLSWLGKNYSAETVANILGNFWLNPTVIPANPKTLAIYQAKLRAELQKQEKKRSQKFEIPKKISRNSRSLGEALLIFLDGVQPEGIFDVECDDHKIATCFCFEGMPNFNKSNQIIAEVNIDFGLPEKQKLEMIADQIVRIPVKTGFIAEVQVKTKERFKLGNETKISRKITGSELGIVFDGRGRPIVPPGETENGEARVKSWLQSLEDVSSNLLPAAFGFG